MSKTEPFDLFPDRYDEWFEVNRFVFECELQAIRELLPEYGKGIEIGVGSGQFASALGIKTGVEPSANMRKIAESRGINVIDGIAENLPIKEAQFDYALMVTTICFLDDLEKALSESFRILKPGGYLIIGFVDRRSPTGQFYLKHKEENPFYRDAVFFSVTEVLELLKKTGFKNFHIKKTILYDPEDIKNALPVNGLCKELSFAVIKAGKKIIH